MLADVFNLQEIAHRLPSTMAFEEVPERAREVPYKPDYVRSSELDVLWRGTVAGALERLRPLATGERHLRTDFWAPACIARCIIEHVTSDRRSELLDKAIRLAFGIAAGLPDEEVFHDLSTGLQQEQVLGYTTVQVVDGVTVGATAPDLSKETAKRVTDVITGPAHAVLISNGGFWSGIQALLYVARDMPDADVTVSIVRQSMKFMDTAPAVTRKEALDLRDRLIGKTVVAVMDEDASRGAAVRTVSALCQALAPGVPTRGFVNVDRRGAADKRTQGEHWENPIGPRTEPARMVRAALVELGVA